MPTRAAYAARVDLDHPHLAGVAAKVRAQVAALSGLPAQVDLYHLSGGSVVCNGKPIRRVGEGALARRIAHYLSFHLALASRTEPLDFLYLRYQGTSPLLLWALKRLRKRNPRCAIFVEIPTWPYRHERGSARAWFLFAMDRLWRRGLRAHVDRIVTFSRLPEIFGIPTIRTENGIDVDAVAVLDDACGHDGFHLLGLANISPRHAYDRVIAGIAEYYAGGGKREVHFDVVGTGAELPRLQELARTNHLQGHVHFHGARRGEELDALMERMDVGVSCLGMHRLAMDTSDLKSREFCARGLPFVLGYDDRDFPEGLPFVFHAPSDESPLDVTAVLAFHDALHTSCPDARKAMRGYAHERLGWNRKMEPVIAALRSHMQRGSH